MFYFQSDIISIFGPSAWLLCKVSRVLLSEDPASQGFETSDLGESEADMSGHVKDIAHSTDSGIERDHSIEHTVADEKDIVHDSNRVDDVQVKQVRLAAPDQDKAISQQSDDHVARQAGAPKPNHGEQDTQGMILATIKHWTRSPRSQSRGSIGN